MENTAQCNRAIAENNKSISYVNVSYDRLSSFGHISVHFMYWKIDFRYARIVHTRKSASYFYMQDNHIYMQVTKSFSFLFFKNLTLICEHLLPSVSIRQHYYVDMLLQLIYVSMQVNSVLTCNLNINMWDKYIHINIMFNIIEADIQLGCQDPKIFLEGRVRRVFYVWGRGWSNTYLQ